MIADVNITVGSVLGYVIAGAIIGAVARLVVPGRQSMSVLATIVLGIVAAIIGGILWAAIFPGLLSAQARCVSVSKRAEGGTRLMGLDRSAAM